MVPEMKREQRLYAATPDGGAQELTLHPAFPSASSAINQLRPGVYEGLRTFDRRNFFGLRPHLDRLKDSIEGFQVPLDYNEEVLVSALGHVAQDATEAFDAEARIRVDVCGEVASAFGGSTNILFGVSPYRGLPEDVSKDGAYLQTACGLARPNPAVKTSDFVALREAWIEAHGDPGAYEYLMIHGDGSLLEGTQSNVCYVRGGAVYSPPSGVLPGVTLRTVLTLAREAGIEVREEFLAFKDLKDVDEVFMTTSVRSVVPVSRIDDQRFAHPGDVTSKLAELYGSFSQERAELPGESVSDR